VPSTLLVITWVTRCRSYHGPITLSPGQRSVLLLVAQLDPRGNCYIAITHRSKGWRLHGPQSISTTLSSHLVGFLKVAQGHTARVRDITMDLVGGHCFIVGTRPMSMQPSLLVLQLLWLQFRPCLALLLPQLRRVVPHCLCFRLSALRAQ